VHDTRSGRLSLWGTTGAVREYWWTLVPDGCRQTLTVNDGEFFNRTGCDFFFARLTRPTAYGQQQQQQSRETLVLSPCSRFRFRTVLRTRTKALSDRAHTSRCTVPFYCTKSCVSRSTGMMNDDEKKSPCDYVSSDTFIYYLLLGRKNQPARQLIDNNTFGKTILFTRNHPIDVLFYCVSRTHTT